MFIRIPGLKLGSSEIKKHERLVSLAYEPLKIKA